MGGIDFDWDTGNTRHLKRHRVTPGEFEEMMCGDPFSLEYQAENDEELQGSRRYEGWAGIDRRLDAEEWQSPGRHGIRCRRRLSAALLAAPAGESLMKQKRIIPAFKSEAEEAEWWHKNRARLDQDLMKAAGKGELKRLDRKALKTRLAASKTRVVSMRLAEADIELARRKAARKGLPYQTYIKSLLHQALRQTE